MTVLDPTRLNLRLPDLDTGPAAEAARASLDRVSELAREAAADLARASSGLELDRHLDDAGQKVRGAIQASAIRAAIARLERELPETDRDRYTRAYLRGRTQGRSLYLGVGLTAGIVAGVTAALLLEPRNGPRRRAAIRARLRSLADRSTARARLAVERAGARATAPGDHEAEATLEPAPDEAGA
jgi:gas vesicle protein